MNRAPSYYNHSRAEMLAFVSNSPAKILEIGCGAGGFRANFGDVEYWGIEPCRQAASAASRKLTRVLVGTYDAMESEIPDNHFDLIVCNDVIEHMTDPISFLTRAKSKLTANGQMIASVPNLLNAETLFQLLFHGDFDYLTAGVLDYTHFHLFTRNSFKKMAERCGWRVQHSAPVSTAPFKFFKRQMLRIGELLIKDLRCYQIGFRLSPEPGHEGLKSD
jgi:2-polyprenyl-3-methyl-5-hydroxy-6-metoxy-1,4-benzoquinol methylase